MLQHRPAHGLCRFDTNQLRADRGWQMLRGRNQHDARASIESRLSDRITLLAAGTIAQIANGVERLASAASRHHQFLASQFAIQAQHAPDMPQQDRRLGQTSGAAESAGERSAFWLDEVRAA